MTQEILKAPPLRTAIAKLAAMLIVGLGVVMLFDHWLLPLVRQYLDASVDRADATHRFTIVMSVFGAAVMGIAIYAIAIGVRAIRSDQWPLAGAFVLRDTPIRRGPYVRVRGIILIVVGVLVALDAALLPFIPYLIAHP